MMLMMMMMKNGVNPIADDGARAGIVSGGVLVAAIPGGLLGWKGRPILTVGWPGPRLWIATP